MISSTEDAEQFFHISGFRISTISYNGTSIGLPSIVAHANYAAFVVGGFQKMLNKGWVGEVSLDAIANNLNFGTSVIIQTSNDGVTWSDQAAATTNRRLVYTNSTPYTIGNYLRVLLVSNSGTANASQSQCRFSNLKITGIDGSLRDFYYNKNLIIDNNGNVGIGTTNPSAKLVIEGVTNNQSQLKITNQNVGRTVVLSANADEPACPFVGSSTNDSFAIYTNNSAKMLINPAGNVGIGATNPINGKLEVLGGSSGAAKTEHVDIAITQDANLTASKVQLRSGVTSGSNPYFAILTRNNNGIATEPGAIKERMRITSAGNVGIGATNPLATLAVQDSSHGGSIQIGSSSGEGQYQYINLANNWQIGKNVSTANAIGQAGSLYIYNIDQSKTNLCITSDGNVGIGTTNPVSAHDRDSVLVVGGGSSFESSGITLGTGSSYANGPYEILTSSEGSHASFKISDGTINRLIIKSNGNVGIGTTNPGTNKLYVNGNIFANGTIAPTSDDRVKHNEQTIVGAIEILGKLTPKKYIKTTEMYDADHDFELDANGDPVDENGEPVAHAIEAGVIAQKVLEVPELAFTVSPEGVDEDGNVTSPHGLNYNSLFTYAIAAIQEQQQLIESQQSTINDLVSRVESLES